MCEKKSMRNCDGVHSACCWLRTWVDGYSFHFVWLGFHTLVGTFSEYRYYCSNAAAISRGEKNIFIVKSAAKFHIWIDYREFYN